jgi:hypothetical protein
MRTTININDALLRTAKLRAAESHRTLTSVIEDALRLAFEVKPAPGKRRRGSIPTSGSGGLLPGVDLDDTSYLLDRLEGRT